MDGLRRLRAMRPTSIIAGCLVGALTAFLFAAAIEPARAGAAAGPSITLSTLPAPPGDTGTDPTGSPRALTCPAPGTCFVIGVAYDPHPEGSIVTGNGTTWSAVQAPLPANNTIDTSNFHVALQQIACADAGSCAIEGSYAASTGGSVDGREGLLLTFADGAWSAVQAPTPADHLPSSDEAYLTSVACDAPGHCIAVGTYLRVLNSSGAWNQWPLVETLSGGTWTPMALPLPADDAGNTATINSVACGASGSCTAVGSYFRTNPAMSDGMQQWPLFETLTGGAAAATAAPLPPDVGTYDAQALQAIACAGTSCASYGSYKDGTGTLRWALQAGSGGAWSATRAESSPSTSTASALNDVSCGGPGNCVIVGFDADPSFHDYALMETLSGGTWAESTGALPSNASTTQPMSNLRAISCWDATDCASAGQYTSQTTTTGLLDLLGGGAWSGFDFGLSYGGETPFFVGVACDGTGMCIAPDSAGLVHTVNGPPPPAPLAITTTSLPNGVDGMTYSAQLTASGGGATPDTFSLASGALPTGLTLSPAGAISGTPTSSGTSTFTVRVTDSASPPDTATATLSITVAPIGITTASLPQAPIYAAYKTTLAAVGGTKPYAWKLVSGSLPKGITLAASTGVLSGTPTVLGTSTFTVQVTDAATPTHHTATATLSLTVVPMSVATMSLPNAPIGRTYSVALKTRGGKSTFHWKITSGTLPAGLTMTAAGVISGTPKLVGTSNFSVQVTDSEVSPETATATESITVTPMTITTASLPNGIAHKAYSAKLSVSGGKGTLVFSISGGSLPPGIKLSSTGAFSGTPTTSGAYTFTVTVHDSATPHNVASRTFTITIT